MFITSFKDPLPALDTLISNEPFEIVCMITVGMLAPSYVKIHGLIMDRTVHLSLFTVNVAELLLDVFACCVVTTPQYAFSVTAVVKLLV